MQPQDRQNANRGPSDKRSKITNDAVSINSGGAQQLTSSIGQKSKKLRKNSHVRQNEIGGSGNYSNAGASIINHQDQLENAK